jgi:hypothetical protein
LALAKPHRTLIGVAQWDRVMIGVKRQRDRAPRALWPLVRFQIAPGPYPPDDGAPSILAPLPRFTFRPLCAHGLKATLPGRNVDSSCCRESNRAPILIPTTGGQDGRCSALGRRRQRACCVYRINGTRAVYQPRHYALGFFSLQAGSCVHEGPRLRSPGRPDHHGPGQADLA